MSTALKHDRSGVTVSQRGPHLWVLCIVVIGVCGKEDVGSKAGDGQCMQRRCKPAAQGTAQLSRSSSNGGQLHGAAPWVWRSQYYVTLPRQEVLWLVVPAVPINPVPVAELVVSARQLRGQVGGDPEGRVTQQPAGKACRRHDHMIYEQKPSPGPRLQRTAGLISQVIRLISHGQQVPAGGSHLIESNPWMTGPCCVTGSAIWCLSGLLATAEMPAQPPQGQIRICCNSLPEPDALVSQNARQLHDISLPPTCSIGGCRLSFSPRETESARERRRKEKQPLIVCPYRC